jgi:hypothetical protein
MDRSGRTCLRDSVAAVDAQVCSSDVLRGIGKEECDWTHEVDGLAHLSLRDQRSPLALQIRIVVQNLLGPISQKSQRQHT